MYMGILPTHISLHHMCAWCACKPEEGPGFSGSGVTDSCKW